MWVLKVTYVLGWLYNDAVCYVTKDRDADACDDSQDVGSATSYAERQELKVLD